MPRLFTLNAYKRRLVSVTMTLSVLVVKELSTLTDASWFVAIAVTLSINMPFSSPFTRHDSRLVSVAMTLSALVVQLITILRDNSRSILSFWSRVITMTLPLNIPFETAVIVYTRRKVVVTMKLSALVVELITSLCDNSRFILITMYLPRNPPLETTVIVYTRRKVVVTMILPALVVQLSTSLGDNSRSILIAVNHPINTPLETAVIEHACGEVVVAMTLPILPPFHSVSHDGHSFPKESLGKNQF